MAFKSYLRFFSVALAAMSMAVACGDSDDPKGSDGPDRPDVPGTEESDLTFTMSATNPTESGVAISIVPSNDNEYYYWDISLKEQYDSLTEVDIANSLKGLTADYLTRGPIEVTAEQFESMVQLEPGTEYYLWAVGYNLPKGTVTTSVTKVAFTTLQGEFTDAYKAWLGRWTVTSASSASSKPLTFTVDIESVNSAKYAVSGLTTTVVDIPATARFDKETGAMKLMCTSFGQEDGGGQIGLVEIYYIGVCEYNNGYTVVSGDYPGMEAEMDADKQHATMKGLSVSVNGQSGPMDLDVVGMEYMALQVQGGNVVSFNPADGFEQGDFPIGPYSMTKTASGPLAVDASQKAVSTTLRLDALKRRNAGAAQRYSFVSSELRGMMQAR